MCVTNEEARHLTFLLSEQGILWKLGRRLPEDRVVEKKNLSDVFDSFDVPGEFQSWHLRTEVLCFFHDSDCEFESPEQ